MKKAFKSPFGLCLPSFYPCVATGKLFLFVRNVHVFLKALTAILSLKDRVLLVNFSPQWVLFCKFKIPGGFWQFKLELCGLCNNIFCKKLSSFNLDWLALVSFLQPIRNVFGLRLAVHLSAKLKWNTLFLFWFIVGHLFYFPLLKLRPKSDKLVVA